MKKWISFVLICMLGISLTACSQTEEESQDVINQQEETTQPKENDETMKKEIIITSENGDTIVFELNDSSASESLYEQLPLMIEVEDYSTNEKIFYPPEGLDITDTPVADTEVGTLAYYAPWQDVVMFYDSYQSNSSLYELGHVVSGEELISSLSGTITIQANDSK